ncbi:MAG: DegT/DnrJ/EryC1/StrS family aminotransferase [Smithella sp.]
MISVNEPLLDGRELQYVSDCVTSGWISSAGKYISDFERKWADYCGMKHGISVCNGTIALELAVEILDFPRGSEIILPAFTIISCAQAITKAGCVPVVVDCDPDTWCMDVSRVEAAITPKTRAIMPVHIYGHAVDMDPLLNLAGKYNLKIIEDAAEVHGAEYKGKKCGGFGDLTCFSFFANKIITTGEGGMILTNSDELAEKLQSYRNLCFQSKQRFLHEEIGHNFRFTNIQAALGLAQLERIEKFVERKRAMAQIYNEGLAGLPVQLPVEKPWAKNVYWMYGFVIDEKTGMTAKDLAVRLNEKGVETRPFFLGMHEQPVFKKAGLFQGVSLPATERISRYGLYLPSGQAITDDQINSVIAAVKSIFK